MFLKIFCLYFTIFIIASAEKKTYNGFKVYKVMPNSEIDVQNLNAFKKNGGLEFWQELSVGNEARIMVTPEKQESFEEMLHSNVIEAAVTIEDVQKLIDNQLKKPKLTRVVSGYDFESYKSLEEIYVWLDELQANYPNIITTVIMGQSFEGRDIKGIKIDFNPGRENPLIGMIEGGIHAREWISPAAITWIVNEFITSTDQNIRFLAENFQWHVFPVVNPDGYSYTFTNNRMWRKNRNPENFVSCAELAVEDDLSNGIDLNRNFDHVWNSAGTSDDPCSNTFAGTGPFSEPETRAIANYVLSLNEQGNFIYYFAFHSYSQLILTPYSQVSGGQDVLLSNTYGDNYEIGIRAAEVIERNHGTHYRVGVAVHHMYEMSGTSFDWVKYAIDVPVPFLFELRDLGEYGFLLPPEQIIPVGQEVMDGLVEIDRVTRNLGYYQNSANSASAMLSVLVGAVLIALFH